MSNEDANRLIDRNYDRPAGEILERASQANPALVPNPAGHLDEDMSRVIPPQAVDVRAERRDMAFIESQQERTRVNRLTDEVWNNNNN